MKMAIFLLTCADDKEADKISKVLLEKKLIACAKKLPVNSSFWWKGNIDKANEVLVLFESIEENFKKVEEEIRKIHSYETFVLFSLPVSQTTKAVEDWLKKELK
ncbi:MAG: divalent-cation tolerance protein CutA [Patescibacteria group bacterium]